MPSTCYLADLEFGVCSSDLTDVYHGSETPVTLCGKHAQSNLQDAFFLLRYHDEETTTMSDARVIVNITADSRDARHSLAVARKASMTDAEQFFYDNAPYSWDTATETDETGHVSTAIALAEAEALYRSADAFVVWEYDDDQETTRGNVHGSHPLWRVALYVDADHDGIPATVAYAGGIDLGADGQEDESIRRVNEAELARENLEELESAKV
jgi:hypothetical protein